MRRMLFVLGILITIIVLAMASQLAYFVPKDQNNQLLIDSKGNKTIYVYTRLQPQDNFIRSWDLDSSTTKDTPLPDGLISTSTIVWGGNRHDITIINLPWIALIKNTTTDLQLTDHQIVFDAPDMSNRIYYQNNFAVYVESGSNFKEVNLYTINGRGQISGWQYFKGQKHIDQVLDGQSFHFDALYLDNATIITWNIDSKYVIGPDEEAIVWMTKNASIEAIRKGDTITYLGGSHDSTAKELSEGCYTYDGEKACFSHYKVGDNIIVERH